MKPNDYRRMAKWRKPPKPGRDETVFDLLHACRDMTPQEIADRTHLCAATIRNWRTHTTRNPQHASMVAVAAAVGMEYRLVRKGSNSA